MKYLWVLLTVFSSSILTTASLARIQKSESYYWNQSEISTEWLISSKGFDLLNNNNCYKSYELYKACFDLVRNLSLAQVQYRSEKNISDPNQAAVFYKLLPTSLVSNKILNKMFAKHSAVLPLNQFSLVSYELFSDELELSRKQFLLSQMNLELKIDSALKKIYSSEIHNKKERTSFPSLFKSVLEFFNPEPQFDALFAGTSLSGYYESLYNDPHAKVEPAIEFEETNSDPDVAYYGIGIELITNKNKVIISRIKNKNSFEGLSIKVGDQIVSVDSIPVTNSKKATKLIRDPEKTDLTLEIVSRNQERRVVVVTKKKIESLNIENSLLQWKNKNYALLKIVSFEDNQLCTKVENEMENYIQTYNIDGWILDLRDNAGGQVFQASCLGGLFLGKKAIYKAQSVFTGSFFKIDPPNRENPISDKPLVVIIDESSASASELLAGALQDYKRAWIVGSRSFGKGTMQFIYPMDSIFENLKLTSFPKLKIRRTVAQIYQPSGRSHQIHGIIPDFPIPSRETGEILREEDLYSNSLKAVGPSWVPTRPKEIAAIDECAPSFDLKQKKYDLTEESKIENEIDRVLLASKEILECSK